MHLVQGLNRAVAAPGHRFGGHQHKWQPWKPNGAFSSEMIRRCGCGAKQTQAPGARVRTFLGKGKPGTAATGGRRHQWSSWAIDSPTHLVGACIRCGAERKKLR